MRNNYCQQSIHLLILCHLFPLGVAEHYGLSKLLGSEAVYTLKRAQLVTGLTFTDTDKTLFALTLIYYRFGYIFIYLHVM